MKNKNYLPVLLADFYKLSHRNQYPKGTEKIYSTWTCRASRMNGVDKTVFFGLQKFIQEYLIDYFNENFFDRNINEIVLEYETFIEETLGGQYAYTKHIEDLHKLGYLPLKITALKEGTIVPIRVPVLTVENTKPEFFWLTNFIETLLSNELWQTITSATIALEFRKICENYAEQTCDNTYYIDYQCHDFSMRGMQGLSSTINSGLGHLLSFEGSDSIPAILASNKYYGGYHGTSIPATEHSVMCSYGQVNELDLLKHLLTEVYPTGIFSVVCDTWDFWKVVNEYLPQLKELIMNRDGKIVIRPDSGNPADIVCGTQLNNGTTSEEKGLIECLWDTFGGTINEKGYKVLDSHIGAIYGDGITLEVAEDILSKLKSKGFAASNIVFGVGSFTYTYVTRDTFGQALKSTYAIVDGEERMLFKDPKTDNGIKKSQKGLVCVYKNEDGEIKFKDGLLKDTLAEFESENGNLLETVFLDGRAPKVDTFRYIKGILKKNLKEL